MEDCRDRRFQIKRYFNNQTFINVNTNNHANKNGVIAAPKGVTYLGEINKETNKP